MTHVSISLGSCSKCSAAQALLSPAAHELESVHHIEPRTDRTLSSHRAPSTERRRLTGDTTSAAGRNGQHYASTTRPIAPLLPHGRRTRSAYTARQTALQTDRQPGVYR